MPRRTMPQYNIKVLTPSSSAEHQTSLVARSQFEPIRAEKPLCESLRYGSPPPARDSAPA